MKRSHLIIAFIPVIMLAATSGYLKTNNTLAEAHFKKGTFNNNMFDEYENALNNDINPGIEHLRSQVEELQDSLKGHDPETAEHDHIESEIRRSENELNNLFDVGNKYTAEANTHYEQAKEHFLKSLDRNHTFGNSAYHLARLFNRVGYRRQNLSYEDLPFVFSQYREEYRHMVNEFDGNPAIMPFAGTTFRRTVEPLYVQTGNQGIRNLLVDIQSLYDSVTYFKTSLLSFNEKNTYRIIGRSNYLIFRNYEQLKELMPGQTDLIEEKQMQAYEQFHHWSLKASHVVPGWSRFSDWEDIYAGYLNMNLTMLQFFSEEEVLNRVEPIVERDGFASYHMAEKRTGIPVASFKVLEDLYNEMEGQTVKRKLAEHITDSYADVYEFYKSHQEDYTNLYISYEYYDTDVSGEEEGLSMQMRHANKIDDFLIKYEKFKDRL